MTNNTKPEGEEYQITKDWFLGLPDFKQLRQDKGLTLRQVEDLTGISNAYLSQLETGKVKKPSFDTVTKLKVLYGVDENSSGYSMTDIERAFCFGYLANNDNNWRDNTELARRVETFKKHYLKPLTDSPSPPKASQEIEEIEEIEEKNEWELFCMMCEGIIFPLAGNLTVSQLYEQFKAQGYKITKL